MEQDFNFGTEIDENINGYKQQFAFVPWRRYFARMFDTTIYSAIWLIIATSVFNVNFISTSSSVGVLDTLIVMLMMILIEPFLLSKFGTTFGKWILGLRIYNVNGEKITYSQGFFRTFDVLLRGLGLHLPIVTIVTLVMSYTSCSKEQPLYFDKEISYEAKNNNILRYLVLFVVWIAVFVMVVFSMVMTLVPPNTGKITVAEFCENYNYYIDYYDLEYDEHLNQDGEWVQNIGNRQIIDFGVRPEFTFTEKNGYLTGVSLTIDVEESDTYIYFSNYSLYLDDLIMTVLSLKASGLSEAMSVEAVDIISNSFLEDFNFSSEGYNYDCKILDDEKQFYVEFDMFYEN